jgi:hypothetical protein
LQPLLDAGADTEVEAGAGVDAGAEGGAEGGGLPGIYPSGLKFFEIDSLGGDGFLQNTPTSIQPFGHCGG